MKNKIFIVTAYRWVNKKSHSYILGVFTKKKKAKQVADSHCKYRGGKYACVVDKCKLNEFYNDVDNHTKKVYEAKSDYQIRKWEKWKKKNIY